jgi:hypothetical protein
MPWISQDLRLFILLWFSRAFQEHLMTLKISEVYTLMSIPWSQASQEYAMALKNIRWILRILMIRLSGALEDSWCLSGIYRAVRTVGSVYTLMNNQGSLGMIRILGSMPGMPGLFKILGNMAWVWVWVWYEYEYDCLWLSRHVGIFILLWASDDLMASRNAIPYASQEYAMIAQEYLVTPMIWWLLWLPMDSYDSYDWIVKSISRHPRLSWCFDAMMLWCYDVMTCRNMAGLLWIIFLWIIFLFMIARRISRLRDLKTAGLFRFLGIWMALRNIGWESRQRMIRALRNDKDIRT